MKSFYLFVFFGLGFLAVALASEENRIVYATRIESDGVFQVLRIYDHGVIEYDDGKKVHIYKQVSSKFKVGY